MLKQVRIKNFRKLRDVTVDFTPGLNVVRGANEQGKSTLLESITYALFGVSACRTSLAEMVTWGEKESTLKVELSFVVEHTTYTIKRGKSGAEITWTTPALIHRDRECTLAQEGRAVGQKEVAEKVGRIFGMPSKSINYLVLAGQGNIRGALSEGSAKTSELIEQLANFRVIDEVLELIADNLTTGAVKPFEEKAAAAAEELAQLETALVPPDTEADEARLANLTATKEAVEEEASAILEEIGPLSARRDALRAKVAQQAELEGRVKLLGEQVQAAHAELQAHDANPPKAQRPDHAELQSHYRSLGEMVQVQQRLKGAEVVKATKYPEGNFWEQKDGDFHEERKLIRSEVASQRSSLATLAADKRVKEAEVVAAGQCGYCGQDFSQLPAAREKNAKLRAQLISIEEDTAEITKLLKESETTLSAMDGCEAQQNEIQRTLARFGDDVTWDKSVYPWRPSWGYQPIAALFDPAVLQKEIDGMEALNRTWDAHAARWEQLDKAATRLRTSLADARAALDAGVPGIEELPALEEQVQKMNDDYSSLYSSLVQTQTEAADLLARVSSAKATYAAAVARVEQARDQKETAEKVIEEIGFNNALQKRVREARPIIANKLWSTVLAAVSRYFSQMRGADSLVTKDTGGFKVDGKEIEALSGSTLDILGLAIRLALVRTFLPQTPLLILDEPSAACDTQRTEAMMGFLQGCGFDQMLLVTHEDTSESVAENLIAI